MATATSYSAVCRNARDANRFRSLECEATRPHRGQHAVVAERIDDHRDAGMVLGRGAHHRRPADVDLLDALVLAGSGLDGLGERVQVDDDELEGGDAELVERSEMLGLAGVGQQAGVHPGVQGLHPAVEHLGEAGDVLDRSHRNTAVGNGFRGRPGGHDGHTRVVQTLGQLARARSCRTR